MASVSREKQYDLLRVVCAIAVVILHVSSFYVNAYTSPNIGGACYNEHFAFTCFWNSISRFSVPCFVMLSGAFILSNDRNADFKYFYKKSFRTLGIPTLLFTALYFLFSECVACAAVAVKGRETSRLLLPIRDLIYGEPYYHLWYMYMCAGLYISAPIIIRLKREIGEANFAKAAYILLLVSSVAYELSRTLEPVRWDPGFQIRFLGYFMAGYVIRRKTQSRSSGLKGPIFICGGVLLSV